MIRQVCVHVFTYARNVTCLVFQSIEVLRHPDVAHVHMPSRMPKTSESNVETREGPNLQGVVRARCRRLDPAPPSHTAVAPTPSHAKPTPKKSVSAIIAYRVPLSPQPALRLYIRSSQPPIASTIRRLYHRSSLPSRFRHKC